MEKPTKNSHQFSEFLNSTPDARINKIPTKTPHKIPNYSGKRLLQHDSPDQQIRVNPVTGHTAISKQALVGLSKVRAGDSSSIDSIEVSLATKEPAKMKNSQTIAVENNNNGKDLSTLSIAG